MTALVFLAGLAALVAGAEMLVRGSSKLALALGISPLVVGLTIVAFGTSSPEVAVSMDAAAGGRGDIALGNVIGSNIFNVLFILGVSALITPLTVHAQIIRQEMPIMIGASVLLLVCALDGRIGAGDAAVLLGALAAYTTFLVWQSRRESQATRDEYATELVPATGWDRHWSVQLGLMVAGLGLLVTGADWLVTAATTIARAFGISDLVIGLTIVAAGTSMPEVATSIAAAMKGERDIAIGNVVGSNTFNILGCLGLSGLVAPDGIPVAATILHFDIWVMLVTAVACLPVFRSGGEIARWEGGLFVAYYAAYTTYLILSAQQHAALPTFRIAMLAFVVPLTVMTLVAASLRRAGGQAPSA